MRVSLQIFPLNGYMKMFSRQLEKIYLFWIQNKYLNSPLLNRYHNEHIQQQQQKIQIKYWLRDLLAGNEHLFVEIVLNSAHFSGRVCELALDKDLDLYLDFLLLLIIGDIKRKSGSLCAMGGLGCTKLSSLIS